MYMKKGVKIFLIIISVLLELYIISWLILSMNMNFKLLGKNNIDIQVFEKYKEDGYKVKLFGKNVNDKIKIKSNVNYKVLGDYKIIYNLIINKVKQPLASLI